MLGQNYPRSHALAKGTVIAFADPVEAVAGRDHPRIGRRAIQILAKVLEDCGVLRRNGGEVIQRFVDAGGQTRGGYVVAQDALDSSLA